MALQIIALLGRPLVSLETSSGSSGYNMSVGVSNDTHKALSVSQPYAVATLSASQTYEFFDSVTGVDNVVIPGPNSINTIVRSVYSVPSPPPYLPVWYTSTAKNGTTATITQP